MIRKVRKVVNRTYDKYSGDEYPLFTDNLNPHYDIEMSTQVDRILSNVQMRVAAIYDSLDEPYEMEENPTNEGLNDDIDKLLRKLIKNPLVGLAQQGFDVSALIGSPALNQLANPMILDCLGLTDSNLASSIGDRNLLAGTALDYTIKFVPDEFSSTDYSNNELKVCEMSLPQKASNFNISMVDGYSYTLYRTDDTTEVTSVVLTDFDENKEFVIHIKSVYTGETTSDDELKNDFSSELDLSDDLGGNSGGEQEEDDDKTCDEMELTWLKYILAVCEIIKLLVNIVSTVLGIIVPLIDMVKQATIAWVDPPMFAAIINDISQKLMALVFSIIGTLLMKLWSLLDFDCVSANAAEVIAQINEVLAGIQECMGAVDALALEIEGLSGLGDLFQELKKNFQKQFEELKNAWNLKNMANTFKETLQSVGEDWKEAFTNPAVLYSEAVPDEIKSDIANFINLYRSGKATVNNTVDTIKMLGDMFNKTPVETTNKVQNVSNG